MFGKRSDGRKIKGLDAFFKIIPYIMCERSDSQIFLRHTVPVAIIEEYVRAKRKGGLELSVMSVFISVFVRVMAEFPELNRFVINKRIFARNELCVCFVVLQPGRNSELSETVAKITFTARDTLYEVCDKINKAILTNRHVESKNSTDKLADFLMSLPLLPGFLIGILKFLDRHGLLPRAVIEASPFHTSLFVSNMASIGMKDIYHHLYNFGTTSLFVAMGKKSFEMRLTPSGEEIKEEVFPLGITVDERILSGAGYAKCLKRIEKYLRNPALLENPPDEIPSDLR